MSEAHLQSTELTSQYSAQVAGDLERNLKEQERLGGELEALQAQLAALQHDHSVLLNIQQALGIPSAVAAPGAGSVAAVPTPRKKTSAASGSDTQTSAKKSTTPTRRRTGAKSASKAAATQTVPKLVDLIREHLASQNEPRSAAEIATALGQQYPERTIKATVVRTTLEGLVAKARAQRSKQGASVFYTASDTTQPRTEGEDTTEQPA